MPNQPDSKKKKVKGWIDCSRHKKKGTCKISGCENVTCGNVVCPQCGVKRFFNRCSKHVGGVNNPKVTRAVIERDGLICVHCKKILLEKEVTLDHVIPSSKGGLPIPKNLVISCAQCNLKRGNAGIDFPFPNPKKKP